MHTHSTFKSPSRQRGLALVILIVVIALAYISYFFSGLSIPDIKYEQDVKTMAALKKAKQALLAYAMNYPDKTPPPAITQGPGNFPCPAGEDGFQINIGPIGAGAACNSNPAGTLGRFPWATLETGSIYDGSGELLWYAVSNSYAAIPFKEINSSTVGQITIKNSDGSVRTDGTSNDAIVAVIFSPGKILVRDDGVVQNRETAAEKDDAINYLDVAFAGDVMEEDNADFVNNNANNGFIHGRIFNAANEVIVNDLMTVITYSEIMELVHARVASELINALNAYKGACTVYPDASEYDDANYDPEETIPVVPDYNSDGFQSGHIPDVAMPFNWGVVGCAAGVILPTWFDDEGWHENTYYQFVTTPCTPGTDCIEIDDDGMPPALRNDVEAVIMFAGRELAGQDRTAYSVGRSEYYEGVNTSDDVFDVSQPDDSIWVVAP